MARIGFLGLGTMGRGMADNLVKAGHDVTVWNRSAVPEVAGAATAGSVADAAKGADFVLSCFADDTAVREVVLAEGRLAGLVDPSTIVVDLSTISPEASDEARGVRRPRRPLPGRPGVRLEGRGRGGRALGRRRR